MDLDNMETGIEKKEQLSTKGLFAREDVKKKFDELLGKRSASFITSVLQIVSQNQLLSSADPNSVYHAAAVAATLDLPINNNLGFAYIVPYNQRQKDGSYKQVAQFQMGYKGFIQLSQRSGQFKTISASAIYEGQLVEENPLTGFVFDFTKKTSNKVIGYASYFQLLNGFEKTLYMSVDQLTAHGKKYSQTFKKGFGLWNDDPEGMSVKTVLKLLLSKFAPLSIEMQKAVIVDQSVVNDSDTTDVTYIDNTVDVIDKEAERIYLMVQDCKSVAQLDEFQKHNPDVDIALIDSRKEELKNGK